MGISSRVPNTNEEFLQTTIQTLKNKFGPDNVKVTYYSLKGLEEAVKAGQVDLMQSSAGMYRRLLPEGVRDLVALSSPRYPDPNQSEGTAFVTRADRTDLQTVKDLKGKILAANSPTGFSGYHIGMHEISKQGYDPEKFFSKQIFVGEEHRMKHVLEALKNGTADVGFLRLCYFEDMLEKAGYKKEDFKIIGDRKSNRLACSHSTSLYPSWTISITPKISPAEARELLQTLLAIPPSSNGVRWSPASDYHSVDTLLKDLKLGPWAYLREWTLKRFINEYWPWIMLLFVCIAGLIAHVIRCERLIKIRTAQLSKAHKKHTEVLHQAEEANSRLESLQKMGAIGLMSGMLAHEIRQPIASIQLYGRGIQRIIDGGVGAIKANAEDIQNAVYLIDQQCSKINAIVEKVRSYSKSKSSRNQVLNLKTVVQESILNFRTSRKNQVDIRLKGPSSILVSGDKLELELVLVNLLRNSLEAQKTDSILPIDISISTEKGLALITISDQAKTMSQEEIWKMEKPLNSSKAKGLGLGLPIVKSIIEAHGGKITFKPNIPKGLIVEIQIPCLGEEEKNEEAGTTTDKNC